MERPYARVTVTEKGERSLRGGHPWVFDNVIERETDCADGDVVDVYSRKDRFLGLGFYNSRSRIRVRLLSRNANDRVDGEFFRRKVGWCVDYRRTVMGEDFDNCRLVFGEADGFPGLTVDRFGEVLVAEVLSLGMERWKDCVYDELLCLTGCTAVYERCDNPIRDKEGLPRHSGFARGGLPGVVRIRENGLFFDVNYVEGQKTGYFLDQKDNHLFLRQFCRDARVLDCFSYIGGFALNAAMGGAREVTAVDISESAVELIRRNAQLNGAQINAVCANCFDFLRAQVKAGEKYDVVVLDPPAFTKAHANMANACRGYKEIALSAMRLLPAGGVLATHSCSYHMPEDVFVNTVLSAAQDLHRQVRVITLRRQDIDHPVLAGYPESHYLKSLWLQMLD